MINQFKNDDRILRGETLNKVIAVLKEEIQTERKRVNEFRSHPEHYAQKQSPFGKLPEEVFCLERCY
jgi:hypothetical protein